MAQNEQERAKLDQNGIAGLLYGKDCPLGYKCLAMDCMDCLAMYAEMEDLTNGESENR